MGCLVAMTSTRRPQVVVIAGPNGAVKTSAAPELLRDAVGIEAFVNADVIAQGLAGFGPAAAAFEAGRIMLGRLDELARERQDFAFESTLAGRSVRGRLTDLLTLGYDVHVFYLWLPMPEMALARVRHRVRSGGHDVPEAVIRRRFWRSLVNFERLYRPIATSWRVYDGSRPAVRSVIAFGVEQGAPVVIDDARWTEIGLQIRLRS